MVSGSEIDHSPGKCGIITSEFITTSILVNNGFFNNPEAARDRNIFIVISQVFAEVIFDTSFIIGTFDLTLAQGGVDLNMFTGSMSGGLNGSVQNARIVIGSDFDDTITAPADNVRIEVGDDNDLLKGNAGSDLILGSDGDDIIQGGNSGDRIIGGAGNDQLVGGRIEVDGDGASDWFLFSSGSGFDIIFDFEDGIDKIDFRGLNLVTGLFPTFAPLADAISENVGNAVISLGGGNVITLLGVNAAQLDATDFILTDPTLVVDG